jgi:ankyrin repeat protein
MIHAAQNGHVEVVDRLLAAGADKDARDEVPGCV